MWDAPKRAFLRSLISLLGSVPPTWPGESITDGESLEKDTFSSQLWSPVVWEEAEWVMLHIQYYHAGQKETILILGRVWRCVGVEVGEVGY